MLQSKSLKKRIRSVVGVVPSGPQDPQIIHQDFEHTKSRTRSDNYLEENF